MLCVELQWSEGLESPVESPKHASALVATAAEEGVKDAELLPRVLELFQRFCSFGSARGGDTAVTMDGARWTFVCCLGAFDAEFSATVAFLILSLSA